MHARVLCALCAFSGLSAVLSCEGDTGNPNEPATGLLTGNTGDVLADVAFDVSCVAPGIGNIEVTAATSGPGADPDYGLLLDGHDRGTITANGTQALPADSAGIHAVGLNGIPASCQPAEENPQPITLLADETANLTFYRHLQLASRSSRVPEHHCQYHRHRSRWLSG